MVVLIHGARLSRTMWASVLPELDRDLRVVTLDLPEHGSLAGVPFTLEGAADLAARVIEAAAGRDPAAGRDAEESAAEDGEPAPPGATATQAVPGVVVAGHSLGGYVAAALAVRRPDLVAGLVICSATIDPSGPARWPTWLAAAAYRLVPNRLGSRLDRLALRLRYGPSVAGTVAAGGIWYRGAGRAVADLVGRPIGSQLAGYHGSAALVNGIGDVPMRVGERSFHRRLPGARRVVIRGASHLVPLDRPRELAIVIRGVVEQVSASKG
jgi:pimeloyl-ACP methyl ester carboxylesterase